MCSSTRHCTKSKPAYTRRDAHCCNDGNGHPPKIRCTIYPTYNARLKKVVVYTSSTKAYDAHDAQRPERQ